MTTPSSGASERKPARREAGEIYYLRNQAVRVPLGYLAVGKVVGVHGLRGELKVELHTDFPERFDAGSPLALGEELEVVNIESARPHKGQLLVKCREIEGRDDAEKCRGLWFFVPETDAVLEAGAHWIHDIIGLTAVTEAGLQLGRITDVLATGANDVYVIRTESDVNQQGRELLIPALADVVVNVDLTQGVMTVRLPDGLLDM
jgi:16S rRNA processing protein RimM